MLTIRAGVCHVNDNMSIQLIDKLFCIYNCPVTHSINEPLNMIFIYRYIKFRCGFYFKNVVIIFLFWDAQIS